MALEWGHGAGGDHWFGVWKLRCQLSGISGRKGPAQSRSRGRCWLLRALSGWELWLRPLELHRPGFAPPHASEITFLSVPRPPTRLRGTGSFWLGTRGLERWGCAYWLGSCCRCCCKNLLEKPGRVFYYSWFNDADSLLCLYFFFSGAGFLPLSEMLFEVITF